MKPSTTNKIKLIFTCFAGLVIPTASFAGDPVTSYIEQGQSVANWQMSVGNALNYYVPVEGQSAKTKRSNLVVSPGKKNQQGDALHLKWKGKKVKSQWGGNALNNSFFSIGKHNIDISSVKDAAALAIEVKVIKAPTEQVTLSMQCKYSNKCIGNYVIKPALRKIDKNKWTVLPIPLNCFKSDSEFDYSQVTNILNIATQGKLEIEIANVGLVALPPGSRGCA